MSTALLGLYAPADGADAGTWGSSWNSQGSGYLDNYIAGITSKSLSSSNVTLTAAEARTQMLRLTGTLLSAVDISVGGGTLWNGFRSVENLTSGNFAVTLTYAAVSVTIPQGRRCVVYLDSTYGPRITGIAGSSTADPLPAGTVCLFAQASAPSGWTQVTTYNDYGLRLVNSTGAGTGGSVNFSTLFARTATDGYTLQIADIPPHTHSVGNQGSNSIVSTAGSNLLPTTAGGTTGSTGGGGSHSHGLDMRLKYLDIIIASRN